MRTAVAALGALDFALAVDGWIDTNYVRAVSGTAAFLIAAAIARSLARRGFWG